MDTADSVARADRNTKPPRIFILRSLVAEIRRQAQEGLPNEICGYASAAEPAYTKSAEYEGFNSYINITAVYPLRNVDASPEHYSFDPAEQFAVMDSVQRAGQSLIASYHSHPSTPSRMSAEDIRLANDSRMLYGIYAVQDDVLNFFMVENVADSQGNAQRLVHKAETFIVEED